MWHGPRRTPPLGLTPRNECAFVPLLSSPLLSSLRCSRIRAPTLSDRRRVSEAYPQSRDGKTTLFPFTRFFLVAKRPSLLEVYGEYAAYHDHQLTKGWKS